MENIRIYNPTPDTVEIKFDGVTYPFFPGAMVEVSPGVGTHAAAVGASRGLAVVRRPMPGLAGETESRMLEDAHAAGLQAWLDNLERAVSQAESVLQDCDSALPKVVPMPVYKRDLTRIQGLLEEAQAYAAEHPLPDTVDAPKRKKGEDRAYA